MSTFMVFEIFQFSSDYPVMVHPAVVYCNASTLATLSCEIHADDFDQWQNVWTQTRNGQFIKDIIGNVNGNISSIDINYCDYIEEGDYKCTWKSKLKTYSATSVVKTNGKEGKVFMRMIYV